MVEQDSDCSISADTGVELAVSPVRPAFVSPSHPISLASFQLAFASLLSHSPALVLATTICIQLQSAGPRPNA